MNGKLDLKVTAISHRRMYASELLRYGLASALALAADMIVYRFLIGAGVGYLYAASGGFVVGLTGSYILCVGWVFKDHRVDGRMNEFAVFAAVGLSGLVLTELLLWLSVNYLKLDAMNARMGVIAPVFVFNFLARKFILFYRPLIKGEVDGK